MSSELPEDNAGIDVRGVVARGFGLSFRTDFYGIHDHIRRHGGLPSKADCERSLRELLSQLDGWMRRGFSGQAPHSDYAVAHRTRDGRVYVVALIEGAVPGFIAVSTRPRGVYRPVTQEEYDISLRLRKMLAEQLGIAQQ